MNSLGAGRGVFVQALSYSGVVVRAGLVVAIVCLAWRCTEIHIPCRVGVVCFAERDRGDIGAEFRDSHRGVWEAVAINGESPEKHMFFSIGNIIQIAKRNGDTQCLHTSLRPRYELHDLGLWQLGKIGTSEWERRTDVDVELGLAIFSWSASAVDPEIRKIQSIKLLSVRRIPLDNAWPSCAEACPLAFNVDLVRDLGNVQQQTTEYHHHDSGKRSPEWGFASKEKIVNVSHQALIVGVFGLAAFFYLCFIGFPMHALETSSSVSIGMAPVCEIGRA